MENKEEINLAKIMRAKGVTTKRLARLSGVHFGTINKYRAHQRDINNACLDVLLCMAEALEVPVYAILDDETLARDLRNNMKRSL